ncbi:transglutaminase family protein [Marinomonas mediterranea]|jgi:Transglutaminase-like enzymes, putative cysteine proteases|uniref:Transglutaminase domain-containing protein n=1 Tax=Marinomonas mediterranea (strain ATCC 700492 / JCM 21426 / NBRC 103028 / MMB-1) TaxID=717774 RepID=F2JUM8_MARM1|nr:transglutaminase family protein [Marinomonas mediterranea]ADZ89361.1 transglutaminase domain-containing protein [Marinomonas mediterranea MMB-1]WCN07462.1 transglutaminase family protein [Marinomonas mediterranea]WCN15626.1 transglutaminase family protein [Marinomonas mediterranea MMB-1]
MKYKVRHLTEYEYTAPVALCYNMAHLLPRDTQNQRCLNRRIKVWPKPIYQSEGQDYYGNQTCYFSIEEPHQKLSIDVISYFEIQTTDFIAQAEAHPMTLGELKALLAQPNTADLRMAKEFVLNSPQVRCSKPLADYAQDCFSDDMTLIQGVKAFMHKVFTEFRFDPTSTTVATPLEQVLEQKSGVCQDFAHLSLGCLRSLGIPTRYMSGYLETLPPPGQEKLTGADASHAWFAVFIPDFGWVEFDPTNDIMPTDQHIVTAFGRDYSDVTPLQGVIFEGGDSQTLSVSVDVQRV